MQTVMLAETVVSLLYISGSQLRDVPSDDSLLKEIAGRVKQLAGAFGLMSKCCGTRAEVAESQRVYLAVLYSAVCCAKSVSGVHDNTERQLELGAYLDEGSMDEDMFVGQYENMTSISLQLVPRAGQSCWTRAMNILYCNLLVSIKG
ncbi:hypothetical protein BsWGS_03982 [Bradybaena similaris]